jgi:hypothetical protein
MHAAICLATVQVLGPINVTVFFCRNGATHVLYGGARDSCSFTLCATSSLKYQATFNSLCNNQTTVANMSEPTTADLLLEPLKLGSLEIPNRYE